MAFGIESMAFSTSGSCSMATRCESSWLNAVMYISRFSSCLTQSRLAVKSASVNSALFLKRKSWNSLITSSSGFHPLGSVASRFPKYLAEKLNSAYLRKTSIWNLFSFLRGAEGRVTARK